MKHDTSWANLLPVPKRFSAMALACSSSCGIPHCLLVTSPLCSLQPTGKSYLPSPFFLFNYVLIYLPLLEDKELTYITRVQGNMTRYVWVSLLTSVI